MKNTIAIVVCITLSCSKESAKPVRIEIEENRSRKSEYPIVDLGFVIRCG